MSGNEFLNTRLKDAKLADSQKADAERRRKQGGATGEDYMEDEKQKPSTFTGRNGKPRKRSK